LGGWSGIFFSIFCPGVSRFVSYQGAVDTYQIVVHTLVELPLRRTTLPQLMVPVVQALPVLAELGQAVGVDVLDTVHESARYSPDKTLFSSEVMLHVGEPEDLGHWTQAGSIKRRTRWMRIG
jgi:hypothetical protein